MVRLRCSVSHVVGPRHLLTSGWVLLGPVRARRGSSGTRMGPYLSRTPIRVHRVFRQGSSGPVRPYRIPTGFRRNPSCFGTTGPDGARRIARLSRIGARLMFGPPGHATASPWALRGPLGLDGRPAARRRLRPADFHRRPPVWAARSSYRRRLGLLVLTDLLFLGWCKRLVNHYRHAYPGLRNVVHGETHC